MVNHKSLEKPAKTKTRAWLHRGSGIPWPEDGVLLSLLPSGSRIPEDQVRRDLTAAILGDLPFWAWMATDGCGWSPQVIYSLQAARQLQRAVDRNVLVREFVDCPVMSLRSTLTHTLEAVLQCFAHAARPVQAPQRSRPEREAVAIVESLHF